MMFALLKAFTPTISEGKISSKSHVALIRGNRHVSIPAFDNDKIDNINSRARVLKGVIFKGRR